MGKWQEASPGGTADEISRSLVQEDFRTQSVKEKGSQGALRAGGLVPVLCERVGAVLVLLPSIMVVYLDCHGSLKGSLQYCPRMELPSTLGVLPPLRRRLRIWDLSGAEWTAMSGSSRN